MTVTESPVALTAELIGEFEPGSPAWHAARAHGLGGSEMAAALDISPWESPYSLWHRKAGLIGPVEPTEIMHLGHLLEPAVATEYANRHPWLRVVECGTYRNSDRPWQIANPDRLAMNEAGVWRGVECKLAFSSDGWGIEGTDDIPVYYRAQVLHYMDTLGLSEFDIAVLDMPSGKFRFYTVAYDPRDAGLMRRAGAAFMASIAAGEPPDLDEHKATYAAVKQLPKHVEDAEVQIPPALADRFVAATEQLNAAEADKREASARVLAAIGNRRRAVCGTTHIATRAVKADGTTHSLQPAKGRHA